MSDVTYKVIPDEDVINVWECKEYDSVSDECCDERAEINPDWYEANGTPTCLNCGQDMFYSHTEIKVEENDDD